MSNCIRTFLNYKNYIFQMNNQAKIQVEDLTQQLDVADKQLRSTRLFLEEQAAERELEREEWEKKLDQAKNSQEPKLRLVL